MTRAARSLRHVNVLGLLTTAAILGIWEVLVRSGSLKYQFLPAPSAIATGARVLLSSGKLVPNLMHTLEVTLLGWLAASLLGITLGLLLGLSDAAWRWSMASIEVMRAIPPVTLVPVALLVFGFSIRMELMIIVFVAAWPVLVNAIDGVRGVRPELVDVARTLRLPTTTRVSKILLPSAMPSILVGLRLAMSLSLVLAVVAEMIGNPAGLGNALVRSQQALQPGQMFAYVLTIGLLGIGLNAVLGVASARILPGSGRYR
jgi:ABC-type nitrate/sulfonate/bicarbonate transport system permease component